MDVVSAEMASLQDQASCFNRQQERLRDKISELDSLFFLHSQRASEVKNVERNIRDNIKCRSMSKDISQKRDALTCLLNQYSSGSPYVEYRRREEELKKEHSELLVTVSMPLH